MKNAFKIIAAAIVVFSSMFIIAAPASAAKPVPPVVTYYIGDATVDPVTGEVGFDEITDLQIRNDGPTGALFTVTDGESTYTFGAIAGVTAPAYLPGREVGEKITVTNETTGAVYVVYVGAYDKLPGASNKYVLYGDTTLTPVNSNVALK